MMASVGGFPSPESTVTSLLTSKLSGQLELSEDQNTPRLSRSGFRNRDVLKESLTDRELDFLKLPVASKHRDSDHVSVTTDDLLLLPVDGSLPVTHTSAFLSRLGSYRLGDRTNSSRWSQSKPPGASYKSSNSSSALRTLCVDDLLTEHSRFERPTLCSNSFLTTKTKRHRSRSSHHIPRWMTSHKSEMDFSGLTSVPDLKYPAWLEDFNTKLQTNPVPSWINELEQNTDEGQKESNSLENIIDQRRACESEEPFREDKIGSLIQRVEEMLKSPSLGFPSSIKEQHDSPGNTEELLDADRSWDNPPVVFKSPVPVSNSIEQEESQKDTKEKSSGSFSSGYSSRKHPGPVEALKQMLFSLQAVEQKVTQQKDELCISSGSVPYLLTQVEKDSKEVSHLDIEDYDSAPGGQSLMRALHHLGRLKSLVDEMNERKAREVQQGGS
ncbi:lung adenoma susceptibility protein 2 isoform X2 [Trichomycterus rosablanca]|uniref:lung adenoma susceptibility protein 2 isoform X2 n=1 Tax=Trichomycterus rosablanca TaxID=2290929 RepID=UPI002F355A38